MRSINHATGAVGRPLCKCGALKRLSRRGAHNWQASIFFNPRAPRVENVGIAITLEKRWPRRCVHKKRAAGNNFYGLIEGRRQIRRQCRAAPCLDVANLLNNCPSLYIPRVYVISNLSLLCICDAQIIQWHLSHFHVGSLEKILSPSPWKFLLLIALFAIGNHQSLYLRLFFCLLRYWQFQFSLMAPVASKLLTMRLSPWHQCAAAEIRHPMNWRHFKFSHIKHLVSKSRCPGHVQWCQ